MPRKINGVEVRRRPVSGPRSLAERLEQAGKSGKLVDLAGPVTAVMPTADDEEQPDEALDETEFTLDDIPDDPRDIQAALDASLRAREVTEADMDRLWDWIRRDTDGGRRFLGCTPATSAEMRAQVQILGDLFTLIDTAVSEGNPHVGFAAVQALTAEAAHVHLYLVEEARGHAQRLVPQLMEMAAGEYPGRVFVVRTEDQVFARMLKGLGFKTGFLCEWTPRPRPVAVPTPDVEDDGTGTEG